MALTMEQLLHLVVEEKASDLHLHAGSPPRIRVCSNLVAIAGMAPLTAEEARVLVYSVLSPEEITAFEQRREWDKAYTLADLARFRINVFYHRGTVAAVFRALPNKFPSISALGLPEEPVTTVTRAKRGLVLVTGATGSGKSTTMASMLNRVNEERQCHIVTIEDPIEFVHYDIQSQISQREIGADTLSFANALKSVLRQDPDVVLIGEMRDLETIQAALNLAETGHLVFGTLHTSDCVQTINRIVDVFPPEQQQQVRVQLSFVLIASFSQILLPKIDRKGRVLACEVMMINSSIRNLIREEKIHQIFSVLQTGAAEGMRTMNQSLYELYKKEQISYHEASAHATDIEDFRRFFKDRN